MWNRREGQKFEFVPRPELEAVGGYDPNLGEKGGGPEPPKTPDVIGWLAWVQQRVVGVVSLFGVRPPANAPGRESFERAGAFVASRGPSLSELIPTASPRPAQQATVPESSAQSRLARARADFALRFGNAYPKRDPTKSRNRR